MKNKMVVRKTKVNIWGGGRVRCIIETFVVIWLRLRYGDCEGYVGYLSEISLYCGQTICIRPDGRHAPGTSTVYFRLGIMVRV